MNAVTEKDNANQEQCDRLSDTLITRSQMDSYISPTTTPKQHCASVIYAPCLVTLVCD